MDARKPVWISTELWSKLKPLARQKRSEPTEAERVLWRFLRGRRVAGIKFRRQHVIDRFIVDFYAPSLKLVIEVDGMSHEYTVDEDAIRTEILEAYGATVIRFTNQMVMQETKEVLRRIAEVIQQLRD